MLVWLEDLASDRRGALVLLVVGLAVYSLQAIAWPLKAGRDLDEYLLAYVQLFDRDVLLPWSMLFRTPVTPLVAGGSLDFLGGRLAEPLAALLFAGSVVAWSAAARTFGPRAAVAVAVALLAYPGWSQMFHELSSETTLAAAFSLWAWLVARAAVQPSLKRFALVGAGIALLALVRPGNAVLLAFAVFPFVLPGTWRERLRWAAALTAAAALPLVAWSVHNGLRFDTWSLARGGNAIVPFYRAFITDHIVAPENGDRFAPSRRGDATRSPHARALSVVRSHPRRALRARQLPSARRPVPPVGPGLRLGRRLQRATQSRGRGRAGASGDLRARRRAHDLGRACEGPVPRRLVHSTGKLSRLVGAADDRRPWQPSAHTDRGPADSRRPGRLDLEARSANPSGLDISYEVALRVRATL